MSTGTPNHETVDSYLSLVRRFRLKHINSDDELDQAIAMIDSLLDRPTLDNGEQEYLDVLSDLVHAYESSEHRIVSSSDSAVLVHLMEANELRQKQLADRVGIAESVISEILSGKRRLNRKQIESISKYFGMSGSVFYTK